MKFSNSFFKKERKGTSFVVQRLRIHLAVQTTRVRSLVGELRSCMPQSTKASMLQVLAHKTQRESLFIATKDPTWCSQDPTHPNTYIRTYILETVPLSCYMEQTLLKWFKRSKGRKENVAEISGTPFCSVRMSSLGKTGKEQRWSEGDESLLPHHSSCCSRVSVSFQTLHWIYLFQMLYTLFHLTFYDTIVHIIASPWQASFSRLHNISSRDVSIPYF